MRKGRSAAIWQAKKHPAQRHFPSTLSLLLLGGWLLFIKAKFTILARLKHHLCTICLTISLPSQEKQRESQRAVYSCVYSTLNQTRPVMLPARHLLILYTFFKRGIHNIISCYKTPTNLFTDI